MQGKMRQDLYQELYKVENSHWWHVHKRAVVRQFLDRFSAKGKLLDVGAGTGKILAELRDRGWEVIGLDGEEEAIQWSAKRGVKVKQLDLHKKTFPFEDLQFDAVLALDLLEHVPNDREVLEEMKRILKPKGIGIITVPAYQWLFSYWDKILGHQRRYTATSMTKVCQKAGFEILYAGYYFSLLLLPTIVVRLIKQQVTKESDKPVSDFQTIPLAFISVPLLNVYLACERWLLRWLKLPFGLSVITVVRKK